MSGPEPNPNPAGRMLERIYEAKGILASVSLSHPQSCTCRTCKAAKGDAKAFAEVVDAMERGR
jgi:hypothetical protein